MRSLYLNVYSFYDIGIVKEERKTSKIFGLELYGSPESNVKKVLKKALVNEEVILPEVFLLHRRPDSRGSEGKAARL